MVFIVSFLVFALVDFAPGDPARTLAGDQQTPERIAEIRANLRLDDPLLVRYGRWVGHAVRGDLGDSYVRGRTVNALIQEKLASAVAAGGAASIVALVDSWSRPRAVD